MHGFTTTRTGLTFAQALAKAIAALKTERQADVRWVSCFRRCRK